MDLLAVLKNRVELVDDTVTSKQLVDQLVAPGPQEEPLHLVELDTVVKRHYDWLRFLPRVRPFYAIKSNNEPSLVETTALLGCGYDCASLGEIRRVLELGVAPERIIFAQPAKTIGSLEYAREKNVRTVFDNEAELRKIQQYYPEAEVLIRYRFNARNAKVNLGVKFGCEPDQEARKLLQLAKELDIKVIGWCFNVGSAISDLDIYYDAIKKGRELTDYAATLGFKFTMIDIGGGYLGEKAARIEQYAFHINKALEEFFPEDPELTVIAEPGRYYCESAVTAISPVHGKRIFWKEDNPTQIENIFYYFNDGIYGSFNNVKCDNQPVKPKIWKKRIQWGSQHRTTFFGPTCDGSDFFVKDIQFPELDIGDFLAFEDTGAYGGVVSCTFNGFCLPKVKSFVRKSTWELLQKASASLDPTQVILECKHLQNYAIEILNFD